jgi:pimeloyl-ACP methyl ester carboxylesterase
MPFARLNDVDLFFTDEGTGTPVVLVHGWTCDSHDWSFQIDQFAAQHRVVALDIRGHGRSSVAADGQYSPKAFASDVAALIEYLELEPVVAIGHSMGAVIVAALAVEYPQHVRGLVEVDAAYGLAPGVAADAMLGAAAALEQNDPVEVACAVLGGADLSTTPTSLKVWHRRRLLGTDPDVIAKSFRGIYVGPEQFGLRPEADAYLQRRECPILVITADGARSEWEIDTFKHAHSRMVSWEGSGHWLHQERWPEFNRLVLEWIDGLT